MRTITRTTKRNHISATSRLQFFSKERYTAKIPRDKIAWAAQVHGGKVVVGVHETALDKTCFQNNIYFQSEENVYSATVDSQYGKLIIDVEASIGKISELIQTKPPVEEVVASMNIDNEPWLNDLFIFCKSQITREPTFHQAANNAVKNSIKMPADVIRLLDEMFKRTQPIRTRLKPVDQKQVISRFMLLRNSKDRIEEFCEMFNADISGIWNEVVVKICTDPTFALSHDTNLQDWYCAILIAPETSSFITSDLGVCRIENDGVQLFFFPLTSKLAVAFSENTVPFGKMSSKRSFIPLVNNDELIRLLNQKIIGAVLDVRSYAAFVAEERKELELALTTFFRDIV